MSTSSDDINFPTSNDRTGSSKSLLGTAIELETSSAPASRVSSSHSLLGIQIDDDNNNDPSKLAEVRQDGTTPRANNNSPAPPARPKALADEGREHSNSSTGNAAARPPRGPPRAPSQRATSPPQRNRRKISDAMSDVSLDSEPGHGRNVSWDMNMLNQPVLSIGAASSLSSGQGKISLADIRGENPIGDEAEASILRSLEARQQKSQSPFGIVGESGMLQHVPHDAADAFRGDSIEQVRSSDTMESARTFTDSKSLRKKASGSPHGAEGNKPHRRLQSAANKVMTQNNGGREGGLTGLAQLMKQMQASDIDDDAIPPPPPGQEPSRLRLRTDSRENNGIPTSPRASGDTYLHNADLLFRRASIPKLGEPSPRGSPRGSPQQREKKELRADAPKSRWNTVVTDVLRNKSNEAQPEISSGVTFSERLDEGIVPAADVELGGGYPPSDEEPQKGRQKGKKREGKKRESIFSRAKQGVEEDLKGFSDFLSLRKAGIYYYMRIVILFLILPCVGIAAIMFYLAENPTLGRVCEVEECATISWFILYLARCAVTFTLAKAAELFFIDYLSLRCRVTVRLLGPLVTLAIVQSKGFPFMIFTWAVFNFLLLSGRNRFAQHWLFFQEPVHLFNEQNPAGTITYSKFNYVILTCALCFSLFVSIKRFILGNYFGKRTYVRYGEQLTTLMKKIILLSKVSSHAKRIEKMGSQISIHHDLFDYDRNGSFDTADSDTRNTPSKQGSPGRRRLSTRDISSRSPGRLIDPAQREMYTKSLARSQKQKIMDVLGAWEEPETESGEPADTSITAMLEFRQALTFMDSIYPFSTAFGPADRRETCIESAQLVYERLLMHQQEGEVLSFDTIGELAMDEDDELDTDKLKEYVRLFRPDRAGKLTMIDFVSSVDAIYKEMRLLRASIVNSGQLDRAFEAIFNVAFYIVAGCIILAALGLSPLALFFSFSSIILAFAFMIGSASAKYFEGILFVLLRRPYDIGDRIHISNVNDGLTINGTLTWFVEKINLYTTTVRLAATNEVATYSNGSLSSSRVINAARSPKVIFHHLFKFGVDVEYTKVQLFRDTITNFIKDRPREYIALLGFRATRVEQEQGFIEYILSVQHRESWQNLGPVLDSKSNLASFGLEVAKKLDMYYRAPPLPVNLTMLARAQEYQSDDQSISHVMDSPNPGMMPDVGSIAALFEPKKDK